LDVNKLESFASEMTDICNVIAIDSHEDALRLVEQNIGTEMVARILRCTASKRFVC
jgi:methylase of polypeptide subunit release factors